MSGPSVVKVRVQSIENQVTVRPVVVASNRVKVVVSQNLSRAAGLVAGPRGPAGAPGTPGQPGADGSGDKAYSQPFNSQSTLIVTHNLGKYPAVTVIDSAGDECVGEVDHLSVNAFTISFSSAFSGVVYCN